MSDKATNQQEIVAVVDSYVASFNKADVAQLRSLFADYAVMNGYLDGKLLEGSPQPFFEDLASKPSLEAEGVKIESKIEHISITGNIAAVVLRETGFGPFEFTNYLHLLKKDDAWRIISKTFTTC